MGSATLTPASSLLIESKAGTVHLTLNRPEKRNALSRELLGQLEAALGDIADDPAARVVMLRAAGPVFCAGHDLGEMTGRSKAEYHDLFAACSRVMLQL